MSFGGHKESKLRRSVGEFSSKVPGSKGQALWKFGVSFGETSTEGPGTLVEV